MLGVEGLRMSCSARIAGLMGKVVSSVLWLCDPFLFLSVSPRGDSSPRLIYLDLNRYRYTGAGRGWH